MLKPQYQEIQPEAGCDEAGRGCLAGPVFAAAVILPADFQHPLLNDSKKLNEKTRYSLREVIINQAVAWAVGRVDAFEIDQINILNASFKAMHMALESLNKKPGFILVDGNRFISYGNIPHATIIKGDGIYASIAAASILAKTFRDDLMYEQDKKYPQYNWKKNKGYGTADHRKAISVHGYTDLHRLSFKLKN
jgi:ribonuclease HII